MLRDVQPRDEGDYSCQLNSIDHAIELVHHLDVLSKFEHNHKVHEYVSLNSS